MPAVYRRPFEPLDLAQRAAAVFSLEGMIAQLRREPVYRTAGRDALTLLHDERLTTVLTVVRGGMQCEDHVSPETTLFIVFDGELAIESATDAGMFYLPRGTAGALARDVRHRLRATSDCAYLMVMARGGNRKRRGAVTRRNRISGSRAVRIAPQSSRKNFRSRDHEH